MTDIDVAINPNKAFWEQGNFSRLAETTRQSGEDFVAALNIKADMRVLDLASGDGTTALPAARRGADVIAVDIASNLVAAGRARAEAEQLYNLRFAEGDACNLRAIDDDQFDLVISTFGAMFAPRPFDAAREMVRVTKPGGRIVMANWIAGDPTYVSETIRISARYMPPPPDGFVSPLGWGDKEKVRERFGAVGIDPGNIQFELCSWVIRYPGQPRELLDLFRTYNPSAITTFAAAERDDRANELEREMRGLVEAHNRGTGDLTEIPATYLKVTVTKD